METKESAQSIFPQTQWSQIARAGHSEVDSLDKLIRQYWKPLKIYLNASFPRLRGDADVWLQDFSQDRILREGWLNRSDPAKGRFRNFLKTSLRNFILDRLRTSAAMGKHVEFDEASLGADSPKADSAFDLMWTRLVLAEALLRMEQDCCDPMEHQPRRRLIWEMFQIRLVKPLFEDTEPPAYESLVVRFQLRSPSEASNMLLSGKRIFKAHLRSVIKEYVENDPSIGPEINDLENFCGVNG